MTPPVVYRMRSPWGAECLLHVRLSGWEVLDVYRGYPSRSPSPWIVVPPVAEALERIVKAGAK